MTSSMNLPPGTKKKKKRHPLDPYWQSTSTRYHNTYLYVLIASLLVTCNTYPHGRSSGWLGGSWRVYSWHLESRWSRCRSNPDYLLPSHSGSLRDSVRNCTNSMYTRHCGQVFNISVSGIWGMEWTFTSPCTGYSINILSFYSRLGAGIEFSKHYLYGVHKNTNEDRFSLSNNKCYSRHMRLYS